MRRGRLATCVVLAAVLIPSLPVVLVSNYLLIGLAFQTVHVVGSAMSPTVVDNDYLIAERLPYRLQPPQRGDIVIMRDPYSPSRDSIKRVIGLPGERVLVSGCKVSINGRQLAEPYINGRGAWSRCDPWPDTGQERPLGSGEFFVMGDNRDRSSDSRAFGPINRSQIVARVRLRILPLAAFGPVDSERAHFAGSTTAG